MVVVAEYGLGEAVLAEAGAVFDDAGRLALAEVEVVAKLAQVILLLREERAQLLGSQLLLAKEVVLAAVSDVEEVGHSGSVEASEPGPSDDASEEGEKPAAVGAEASEELRLMPSAVLPRPVEVEHLAGQRAWRAQQGAGERRGDGREPVHVAAAKGVRVEDVEQAVADQDFDGQVGRLARSGHALGDEAPLVGGGGDSEVEGGGEVKGHGRRAAEEGAGAAGEQGSGAGEEAGVTALTGPSQKHTIAPIPHLSRRLRRSR